jgi:Na+-transporting NADH:ubiquinone oxidoreductase, subunit NqrC
MSDTVLAPVRAVLALPNDDPRKTLAVALALCLACSVVVSATAVGLRPLQARNAALELKREVVKVAGLDDPGVPLSQAFGHIETRLVDLETGTLVDGDAASTFAYRDAARDPSQSKALEDDPAGIRRRPNRMPVYLVRDDGALETIVLPVYGQGLWSTCTACWRWRPTGARPRDSPSTSSARPPVLGSEVGEPPVACPVGRQEPSSAPRG